MPEVKSPIKTTLEEIHALFKGNTGGRLPDYIPELAKADPNYFGITLATVDGQVYEVGDTAPLFTIQSISKPFVYGLALEDNTRPEVLAKVGVEPSGEAFNSISLDPSSGRPMNPMINAGAIASTGLIQGGSTESKFDRILEMFQAYTGRVLTVDLDVYRSESATGHRNRAIGHMLRNFGILEEDPNPVLDLYFRQCSIAVNCRDLGVMAATLANMGTNPLTGRRAIRGEYVESVLSVMGSCGMYDYAGEWIYRVGMPAKSGVAGGIIAVLPGQLGIGVYSPLLDSHGNSVRGIEVCNKLSLQFNLHVFNVLQSVRSVIRLKYDGAQVASNRQRGHESAALLRERADQLRVYELQGELVFATTEAVVRDLLAHLEGMSYVIIDLKRVLSIDQSACLLFSSTVDVLRGAGVVAVFTHAAAHRGLRRLVRSRNTEESGERWIEFEDNNAALAYCEDRLLGRQGDDPGEVGFMALDVLEGVSVEEKNLLRNRTAERVYEAGDVVVNMGDRADSIFFLVAGRVSVELPLANGGTKQLVSYHPGVVFGEMAFLDGAARSAMVRAETRVVCRELTRKDFDEIGTARPALKIQLLHNLLRVLSANLRKANREISILGQ